MDIIETLLIGMVGLICAFYVCFSLYSFLSDLSDFSKQKHPFTVINFTTKPEPKVLPKPVKKEPAIKPPTKEDIELLEYEEHCEKVSSRFRSIIFLVFFVSVNLSILAFFLCK